MANANSHSEDIYRDGQLGKYLNGLDDNYIKDEDIIHTFLSGDLVYDIELFGRIFTDEQKVEQCAALARKISVMMTGVVMTHRILDSNET